MNIKPKSAAEVFSKLRLEKKLFAKGAIALRMGPIPKASGITCSPYEEDSTCIGLMKEFLNVSIGSARSKFARSKGRRTAGDSRHNYVSSLKRCTLARMDTWLTEAAAAGKAKLEVVSHGGD